MTYYTGLDVSLRSVSICIIDDKGDIQHEAKVAAEVDQIVTCLRASVRTSRPWASKPAHWRST